MKTAKKIKKSHSWDVETIVNARCPYCGYEGQFYGHTDYPIGDYCVCGNKKCAKLFEIGEPK